MSRQPSQISDRLSAEWLAGYRAALADLDWVLANMGGRRWTASRPMSAPG